jgi:hypothetical protein
MDNENKDIVLYINNNKDEEIPQIINNDESETPKIEPINNKVFIDILPRIGSASADLVNVTQGSQTSEDKTDLFTHRTNELLDMIRENKRKITTSLYIVSSKYDFIYHRYNKISLLILSLSTIITFVEAIRLTIVNYDTQYKESKIKDYISQETVSLIINVLSLSLSTILTILSSIVKFKNYKENMDKLKNIHDTLFNYKNLYDKQKELIKYFKMNNSLTDDLYDKLKETIEGYTKDIKDISIFENIRNEDIIKFNKIKVNHDIKLQELAAKREIELLKITINSTNKKKNIEEGKISCCFN